MNITSFLLTRIQDAQNNMAWIVLQLVLKCVLSAYLQI